MARVRNVLFVMTDQLRTDYLSAYGHPTLKTPNIDALAARGVRFTRDYVQSPVCGPARMSYYTRRYVTSHGATWNNIPLSVGGWTLGDYVRPLGPRVGLVGKTHMRIGHDGFSRLGLDQGSTAGRCAAECGFEHPIPPSRAPSLLQGSTHLRSCRTGRIAAARTLDRTHTLGRNTFAFRPPPIKYLRSPD